MKSIYKLCILLAVMTMSFDSMAQRITVRRSDGSVTETEDRRSRSSRRFSHPFAAKLHLNKLIFGEYMGSVEYALADYFTLEGGLSLTSHDGNAFAGLELFTSPYPSGDLDGAGLGFGYLIEGKFYQGEDALEDDVFYGVGYHGKKYHFYEQMNNVQGDYEGNFQTSDLYLIYGYSMEFDDKILLTLYTEFGLRSTKYVRYQEFYDGTDYEVRENTYDDNDLHYSIGISLGYIFK